ncbi:hypothetical protein K2173_023849 [Erythroxylum novogranatense]|uniref:DUF4219 domain-containing protein n=1 Tax=Erythroxylum novogranatense TaxID=1862640 RepID=A0AAV8TSI2_9ROSI|nr:hypothetical protein K2173_023849 [Erythroxylum novogranatense]
MSSNSIALNLPEVFNGENYQMWSVKMQSYLEAFDLWEVVTEDRSVPPLLRDPTMAQIKFNNEEKAKKSKAKTLIQIYTAKEAWDRLKEEYQGTNRTRQMQVLNLKRDFESLTMKEDETITRYFDHISLIVNNIKLLREDFPDRRIVEKVLVTLPKRFESKVSSLEESKNLSEISLVELMNAL